MTESPDQRIPLEVAMGFRALRTSARQLRQSSNEKRQAALEKLADLLELRSADVLNVNKIDLSRLKADAVPAFRDRLTLNPERIRGMAESLRQVARLPDPLNEVVESRTLENGLKIKRVRAPLGTILMVFESRPNVALEAFSLAFKSGNAIGLRGGSESRDTVGLFYELMREALAVTGFSADSFYGVTNYDRVIVEALLARKDWIDIVVPRGGDHLIEFVENTALMPIIKNDRGLCHTFIDETADLEMAVKIVENAKIQRPGVCNSLETVLVHSAVAADFLPMLFEKTSSVGLKWHVDQTVLEILPDRKNVRLAESGDWDTEYLDLVMNAKVVASLDDALAHIEKHGSRHSEAIVTQNENHARHFQNEVDAAAVYWNASTRFTDGFALGLGGELGISTQKLHVRGPVGLRELTTPRWVIDGTGQIRS